MFLLKNWLLKDSYLFKGAVTREFRQKKRLVGDVIVIASEAEIVEIEKETAEIDKGMIE